MFFLLKYSVPLVFGAVLAAYYFYSDRQTHRDSSYNGVRASSMNKTHGDSSYNGVPASSMNKTHGDSSYNGVPASSMNKDQCVICNKKVNSGSKSNYCRKGCTMHESCIQSLKIEGQTVCPGCHIKVS